MLSPADRQAFSLAIVNADQQITGLQSASAQITQIKVKDQALDTANDNLFIPVNNLINEYQAELNLIDGNVRTSLTEQNLLDSANKVIGNYLFPNNVQLTIPSLSSRNNVWTQTTPFALAFGVGQQYNQTYGSGTAESSLISTIQSFITSASMYTNIQNTSGQYCVDENTCSIPLYDGDESGCTSHSGTWTASDTVQPYPAVQALKTNTVTAVNALITQLNLEVTALSAIVDTDSTRTSQNTAALNYINNTLLPALNTWLAYPDFNTVPGGVTTCAAFNSYDPSLLAPTKLYSVQLAALSSALSARSTFLTTRTSQLNNNLGSIIQDLDAGTFSGSGLYLLRFSYINLRLNLMSGLLTAVTNDQQSLNAQSQMVNNLNVQTATYMSICPTVLLSASASGTNIISVTDASDFSIGNTVYVMSATQPELQRAISAINGNSIQLNDVISAKYSTLDGARMYRDNT